MRGESHVGSQVATLAHPCQGGSEHEVTLYPQRQRHRCPFPPAAEAAVNDHERRHGDKPPISPVHRRHAATIGTIADRQQDGYLRVPFIAPLGARASLPLASRLDQSAVS